MYNISNNIKNHDLIYNRIIIMFNILFYYLLLRDLQKKKKN